MVAIEGQRSSSKGLHGSQAPRGVLRRRNGFPSALAAVLIAHGNLHISAIITKATSTTRHQEQGLLRRDLPSRQHCVRSRLIAQVLIPDLYRRKCRAYRRSKQTRARRSQLEDCVPGMVYRNCTICTFRLQNSIFYLT